MLSIAENYWYKYFHILRIIFLDWALKLFFLILWTFYSTLTFQDGSFTLWLIHRISMVYERSSFLVSLFYGSYKNVYTVTHVLMNFWNWYIFIIITAIKTQKITIISTCILLILVYSIVPITTTEFPFVTNVSICPC